MVRRIFFSFHFDRDAWRASQVRNTWVTKEDREAAGYEDAADWEEVKQEDEDAIKSWIDGQIHGTSVTAILIGRETSDRDFVQYEIKESIRQGNGIVGIRIHDQKNKQGKTDFQGSNPLKEHYLNQDGDKTRLDKIFETYHWERDDGRENVGEWVEEAAQLAEDTYSRNGASVERDTSSGLGEVVGIGVFAGLLYAAWEDLIK